METVYTNETAGASGMVMDVTQKDDSRLQRKIDVVQKVMTVLENTMSSAKIKHHNKQSEYLSKIKDLERGIQKLRGEMDERNKSFKKATDILEADIHKYMALDNKLITLQEDQTDDRHVKLPDLSNTDKYVEKYLEHGIDEWHELKLECQKLNQDTRSELQSNLSMRRFRIYAAVDPTEKQFCKAANMANALNIHRGKKYNSKVQTTVVQDIALTWYKNEDVTERYVQNNCLLIIQEVYRKDFPGRKIDIAELYQTDKELDCTVTQTIHVQPRTSTAVNVPRTITLYQFDEAPSMPPEATTFRVVSAPSVYVPVEIIGARKESHDTAIRASVLTNPSPKKNAVSRPRASEERRLIVDNGQRVSETTDDIFVMLGIDGSVNSVSMLPQSQSAKLQNANDVISNSISKVQEISKPTSSHLVQDSGPSQISKGNPSTNIDKESDDGVVLQDWIWEYVKLLGIARFTETQAELLKSLRLKRDIHYKGIANSGKTTCVIVALLNSIDYKESKTQALFITANSRSSKLVQKVICNVKCGRFIICQRTDEILPAAASSKVHQSSCQILVGTRDEMTSIGEKNIIDLEIVKFLVIDNSEDIFGPGNIKPIYKILYLLPATIQVIVVSRTACNAYVKINEFCRTKLRDTLELEETVDIEEFLHGRRITKAGDSYRQQIHADEDDLQIDTVQMRDYTVKQTTAMNLPSTATRGFVPTDSSSEDYDEEDDDDEEEDDEEEDDEDDEEEDEEVESGSTITCCSSSVSSEVSEIAEVGAWQTFIPLNVLQTLGICIPAESKSAGHSVESGVSHLYANINGDNYKVEIITKLDIEEDKTMIFCNSIEKTEWLSTKLRQQQLWPQVLHEDVSRKDQKAILENFRQGSFCRVLIATDFLASISLDAADVVLNFDLPNSENRYMTRSAFAVRNTCRTTPRISECNNNSDRKGVVVSLINENELESLKDLGNSLGITIENAHNDED